MLSDEELCVSWDWRVENNDIENKLHPELVGYVMSDELQGPPRSVVTPRSTASPAQVALLRPPEAAGWSVC